MGWIRATAPTAGERKRGAIEPTSNPFSELDYDNFQNCVLYHGHIPSPIVIPPRSYFFCALSRARSKAHSWREKRKRRKVEGGEEAPYPGSCVCSILSVLCKPVLYRGGSLCTRFQSNGQRKVDLELRPFIDPSLRAASNVHMIPLREYGCKEKLEHCTSPRTASSVGIRCEQHNGHPYSFFAYVRIYMDMSVG